MNRLATAFNNKKAYVGYVVAGDGGKQYSLQAMLALIAGGVDILEIGVPFTDPVADGPVIQAAAARALQQGITLEEVLQLVKEVRAHTSIPIILFTYYNPILQAYTHSDFFVTAKQAGVDGLLVVDVPLEEMDAYYDQVIAAGIDPILLIAPSTPLERIKAINAKGKGMLYYVCRKGTTGVKNTLPDDLVERIAEIKSVIDLPLVVGFGISRREMAAAVSSAADGFVVGSLFVQAMAEQQTPQQLMALARSLDPR